MNDELPTHDPLTCGLHGLDSTGKERAYCPRCVIDGEWRDDKRVFEEEQKRREEQARR